ncbi:MAG TPA: FliM/FliN family flagellar motor switch protein [Bryobacteraceae bacterium]|nr:FliM/FliN family flagellar motor switch protein [Bryobacteraceae bacterium]HPT27924.1 FliM/FliN family flagellar motor switch protein [Bryobacteraceae bacterium]
MPTALITTHPSVPAEIRPLVDVDLTVEVELDRRVMTVREILDLDNGSVIRMYRSAGENINISIGGSVVGFGEIVIIEDTMGIRITDFNIEE